MRKVRKTFRMTPEQAKYVSNLAQDFGVSQSEIVRRIIDAIPEEQSPGEVASDKS